MTSNAYKILEKYKFFGLRKIYHILIKTYDFFFEKFLDLVIYNSPFYQSLIKTKISKILIMDYNGDEGHNINNKNSFIGFGLIHYAIIRNIKPTNILCIGSRKGFIPAILALACKDNGTGHVDFVDAGYDQNQPTKHWSGIGFWKKSDPMKHFAKIGVSDYITAHVMTTKRYAAKYPKKRYQYVYVDGDHSYTGVKLDYMLFWPKLERHGFMVYHDVVAKGYLDQGKFGVWRLWKELKSLNKIIFPFPKDSGLGILQKT